MKEQSEHFRSLGPGDRSFWGKHEKYTLWEAACLICEYKPPTREYIPNLIEVPAEIFKIYDRLKVEIQVLPGSPGAHVDLTGDIHYTSDERSTREECKKEEILSWCNKNGFSPSSWFREKPKPTDEEGEKRSEELGHQRPFTKQDLEAFSDREIKTLYKIISGLLKINYGEDAVKRINATRSDFLSIIKRDLGKNGIEISMVTLRKYLKNALLE